MGRNIESKSDNNAAKLNRREDSGGNWGKLRIGLTITLGIFFCCCHSTYVSSLFEKSRHFSHLSTMEREMSFRTEMGFYYYYYKTIVESSSFGQGVYSIMNDNLTEFPKQINTLKRFNVYPEVIISAAFRTYTFIMDHFGIKIKDCWLIDRGEHVAPVESCVGLGEPVYFYIACVWLLSGLTIGIVFLYSVFLSGSLLGGIISVACFFYNHGECTRVQWTPPLRESFGYPLALGQMFAVSVMLRQKGPRCHNMILISFLTAMFISFWQFASFVLTTQLLAMFGLYIFCLISKKTIIRYLTALTLGFGVGFSLLFFNEMLMTSILTVAIASAFIVVGLERTITSRCKNQLIIPLIQGGLFVTLAFFIKRIITCQNHDAHIWNFLRAKFSNYSDFHTSLYTCSVEFDYIGFKALWQLMETFLLPTCVMVIVIVIGQICVGEYRRRMGASNFADRKRNSDDCEIVYNTFQLLAFMVMAIVVMRFKLFFTPHLCIIVALLCSRKFFGWLFSYYAQLAIAIATISLMSVQGISNLKAESNIVGEYNNPHLEGLFLWIKAHTPPEASFAGPMPIMANLLLSTRRPIVNHPHYEDLELRERTKKVYTLFSRKPLYEVVDLLVSMRVNYAVLNDQWCYQGSREGCAMLDLWDREDIVNIDNISVCDQISKNPTPLTVAFQNEGYIVIKLPTT